MLKTWAVCSCVLWSLLGSSDLLADPIQITGGVSGVCVTNCDNSPNLLVPGDIGVYMTCGCLRAQKDLLSGPKSAP